MPDLIPRSQPPPGSRRLRLRLRRRQRNPLQRRADRLRAVLGAAIALTVLAAAPAGAILTASLAHDRYQQTAHHQEQNRQRVTLTLLDDSPRHSEPGSKEAQHTRYPVAVRWTDPAGHSRTGTADVPPGLPADSKSGAWSEADGTLTDPPMPPDEVRNRTLGWALTAGLGIVVAGILAHVAIGRRLERRNLAAWERAWASTGPRWTTPT